MAGAVEVHAHRGKERLNQRATETYLVGGQGKGVHDRVGAKSGGESGRNLILEAIQGESSVDAATLSNRAGYGSVDNLIRDSN